MMYDKKRNKEIQLNKIFNRSNLIAIIIVKYVNNLIIIITIKWSNNKIRMKT